MTPVTFYMDIVRRTPQHNQLSLAIWRALVLMVRS